MEIKRFFILLFTLCTSLTSVAQYVEPLNTRFEDLVNPMLLNGDVLARNENGEELISAIQLDENYYYVAIRLSGDRAYYGVSLVGADSPDYQDILKGLRLIGEIVMPNGTVFESNLYRDENVVKAETKAFNGTLYRNVWDWFDTNVEFKYDKIYTFHPNGTGSITIHYGTYGLVAPQGATSSWQVGHNTYHHLTGGYYYDTEGIGTQMFTWDIKGDILILKVVSSRVSVKASLDNEWLAKCSSSLINQFKDDLPKNQDVKAQKKKVKSTIESIQSYENEIYRFFITNDNDIVLLPLYKNDDGELKYNSGRGVILHKTKPDIYIRNEGFDMFKHFEIANNLRLAYLHTHYNQIKSNTLAAFTHMMEEEYIDSIYSKEDLCNWFVIYDEQLNDGLAAFRGITDFSIYNIDPIERKAHMFFVRNWQDVAQFCTVQLFFTEDDLLIADALNAKYVMVSNYMSELNEKILARHAYLKDNKKDPRLACDYKVYIKKFKSMYQEPKFKTLDEFYKLDDILSAVLDMQMEYCARLE